jgi:hypothetical protein
MATRRNELTECGTTTVTLDLFSTDASLLARRQWHEQAQYN